MEAIRNRQLESMSVNGWSDFDIWLLRTTLRHSVEANSTRQPNYEQ